jgi:hypothetical protein
MFIFFKYKANSRLVNLLLLNLIFYTNFSSQNAAQLKKHSVTTRNGLNTFFVQIILNSCISLKMN